MTLHIRRLDGIKSNPEVKILTEFLDHRYYHLQAEYRVHLPWLDSSVTGLYTITAHNTEDQSATLDIRLHRMNSEALTGQLE